MWLNLRRLEQRTTVLSSWKQHKVELWGRHWGSVWLWMPRSICKPEPKPTEDHGWGSAPFLWFKNMFKQRDFGVLEITVQACSHLDMQESCLLFPRVQKYPRARAGAIAQVEEDAERMQKLLGGYFCRLQDAPAACTWCRRGSLYGQAAVWDGCPQLAAHLCWKAAHQERL